jgi:hypothetical protein
VLYNRKQTLEEEITQGRRRLTDGQAELLRLAMNLCRDESVTETARRSVEVQFRRLEIVEKCAEKATQEEASERSRAQVGENEFLTLKSEAVHIRDRTRDVSREICSARASGILSRTDANNHETETQLVLRIGPPPSEDTDGDTTDRCQIAQLRTFYQKDIAEVQQLNHETTELTPDLKFLKLSIQVQKETLTSTDDQGMEMYFNVSRVRGDSAKS